MGYFTSKERVERDGYLVYAEGDEIPATDVDELKRQGYVTDDVAEVEPNLSKERVVRDGVLIYAEGDVIADSDLDELERQGYDADAARARLGDDAPLKAPAKSAGKDAWAAYRAGQGHDVEGLTKEQLVELPDVPVTG